MKKFISLIKEDLFRYKGKEDFLNFLITYFKVPGFNYLVWLRLAQVYKFKLFKFILRRKMIKFGIEIYPDTNIGKGFYIGHFGGIVINSNAVIGNYCNISHCVTIGQLNRGRKKGVPIIGNNVYIGPGAKILGKIKIGNNVVIGANSVVINDVPDNAVVGGIPAKIISYKGSKHYINNIKKEK